MALFIIFTLFFLCLIDTRTIIVWRFSYEVMFFLSILMMLISGLLFYGTYDVSDSGVKKMIAEKSMEKFFQAGQIELNEAGIKWVRGLRELHMSWGCFETIYMTQDYIFIEAHRELCLMITKNDFSKEDVANICQMLELFSDNNCVVKA